MTDGIISPEAHMRADGVTTERLAPRGRGRRVTLLTLAECANAKPRGYLVKGLIAPGDLVVLFGPPGSGKSVLAPYLAHAVAAGRMVFGRRVRPGPVLYIAAEDPEGMKMRATALRAVYGDTGAMRVAAEAVNLQGDSSTDPPDHTAIIAAAEEIGAVLIVLDTVAKAFPGLDENDGRSMGRAVHLLRRLTTPKRAVIAVHHGAKPTGNTAQGGATPRGHGVLNGDADVTLRIDVAEATGIRTVILGKNRNGVSSVQLSFVLRGHTLGTDEDGDPITTVVAEEAELRSGADGPSGKRARAMTPRLEGWLRDLTDLFATLTPQFREPLPGMKPLLTLTREEVRAGMRAKGRFEADPHAPLTAKDRTALKDALNGLKDRQKIGMTEMLVWLA